jgi:hypothetical protein
MKINASSLWNVLSSRAVLRCQNGPILSGKFINAMALSIFVVRRCFVVVKFCRRILGV